MTRDHFLIMHKLETAKQVGGLQYCSIFELINAKTESDANEVAPRKQPVEMLRYAEKMFHLK